MDLGLTGRQAIVCGASQGLGLGCAQALAAEGAKLTLVARNADALEAVAATIGGKPIVVAADLRTAEGRAAVLAATPEPDILVTNIGGPMPGGVDRFSREDWIDAFDSVLFPPLELIRAVIGGMADRGFGRIVNISASLIKQPMEQAALANARLVLSGLTTGMARGVADRNVTINHLLPGVFDTGRIEKQAEALGVAPDAFKAQVLAMVPARRMGTPSEFGAVCAFLCSDQAGYLNRQNLMLDGGAFPGIL